MIIWPAPASARPRPRPGPGRIRLEWPPARRRGCGRCAPALWIWFAPDSLSCSGSGCGADAASRRRTTLGDRHHDRQRLEAFDQAADRYELMVGLNRLPRPSAFGADALAERLPRSSGGKAPRCPVADLGCGRASTRALLDATRTRGVRATVVGVDAAAGMLGQARAKSWPPGVNFEVGLAEELAFARESWGLGDQVPGVLAAYLFRNVTERDKVLAGVFDLLEEDGTFVVQEYSVPARPRRRLWSWSAGWWASTHC